MPDTQRSAPIRGPSVPAARLVHLLLSAALALALSGCPTNDPVEVCVNTKCGTSCCLAKQVCHVETSACCSPTSCDNRECGTDGCGTSCGSCAKGTLCNEVTWTCDACPAETKDEFCARQAQAGKVCGTVTETDQCTGDPRSEDCGSTCANGKACAADNTCSGACLSKTPEEFCAAWGKDCGQFTAPECGEDRTEDCGTCTGGKCLEHVCVKCSYEGDQSFCDRMAADDKVCGTIEAKDNCDVRRKVHCGTQACLGFEHCDEATNTCQPCVEESSTDFCARMAAAGRRCGVIDAPDNCGHARTEDCGDPCPAQGKVCSDFVCLVAGKPANDTCAGAEDLAFGPDEVATATGDTSQAMADLQGSCTTAAGADVVYRMTVGGTAARKVTIDVTAIGSRHLAPVVYLRTACAAGLDLACARGFGQATARVNLLAPGTYYVVVDSEGPDYDGPFDLRVALGTPDPVPANDACDAPQDVTYAAGPVSGTTVAATDDSKGSCSLTPFVQDGPDVVYSFKVSPGDTRSAKITVTADPSAVGFHPTVSVRTDCGDVASEIACAQYEGGGRSSLFFLGLGPGLYYVVVDGENGSQGPFQLSVDLAPAINLPDGCAEAKRIDLSTLDVQGNGTVLVADDTTWASNDSEGECGYTDGHDLVYLLVTNDAMGTKDVKFTVTFQEKSIWPTIYLRKGSCDAPVAGDEVGCSYATGGPATLVARSLPPGSYYVWIDAWSGDMGTFTLQVDITDPIPIPGNDGCGTAGDAATPVALDAAGHGTAVGDTLLAAANDASPSCGSWSGRDLVYLVDTTGLGARDLTASVTFTGATTTDAMLYLWKACDKDAVNNELACDAPAARTAAVVAHRLPEGRYYLWVDSAEGAEGGFVLTVDAKPPPPSPCLSALPLDLSAGSVTSLGSTKATIDYTQGSCGGARANDQVFSFTLAQAQKVIATVTPSASSLDYQPVIYLRKTSCDGETRQEQLACAKSERPGDAVTTSADYVEPGTYWVWVDGDLSAGNYELKVDLAAAIPPPANDTCAAPQALVLGAGPVAGDTSNARSDYGEALSAVCFEGAQEYNAGGNDLVYTYTPSADAPFLVTVAPTTDADLSLWYTEGTCGGDGSTCVMASDAEWSGGTESLVIDGVAGTTYYLYVDRYSDSLPGGPFTIELKSLSRPSNDTCLPDGTGAIALAAGVWVDGDTTLAAPDYGEILSDQCELDTGGYDAAGRDLVYSYAPAVDGEFRVAVEPAGWDASLWYSVDYCGDDGMGCVSGRDGGMSGGSEELTVWGVAGTTYYFYVDRYELGAGGSFRIAVDPPSANIPNDTCGSDYGENAIEIFKGVPVQGDLTGANPDYGAFISPACYADTGWPAAGDDLVYVYIPQDDGDFAIEIVPDNWDPALWYTIDWCGSDGWWCVHAADAHGEGGSERLVVHGVAGSWYFIYVDRYAADTGGGPFTLLIR